MDSKQKIASNVIIAMAAQLISVVASFVLGIIVPKFIDEYQYAYWQTFVLYFNYIGLVPLGILDGLILRYSQYDYNELDKPKIASQFRILMVWSVIVAVVIAVVGMAVLSDTYKIIALLLAVDVIIHIYYAFNYDMFQITNRINYYAISIMLQRGLYMVIVIICLIFKVESFVWICLAEIIAELIAGIFASHWNKGLFLTRGVGLKDTLSETKVCVSAGFLLMVANFSSTFLITGAKMVIQWHWDMLVFGKMSFAFSVTNLFLTFVTAISVVLFPSLKRMKEEELPALYGQIRNAISPLLFLALLLYFPMCWILELWLPKYTDSLVYLGILLPIIVYSSKVNLLTNNYLKAYRKEKIMFIINIVSVVIGFGLALFFAYVVENLDLLLFSVVFVVILRSIVSEVVVGKIIKRKGTFDYIVEIIMTVIFIAVARYLSLWWGCLAYAIALIIYFVLYRKNLVAMLNMVKDVIQKRKAKKQGVEDNQTETDISDDAIE